MNRCPRGCRPAPVAPVAGYIDDPQASIGGRQSIWIAPDGSDLDSSRDTHGWTAAVILRKKRPERPEVGYNAMLELMTRGWIRMHLAHGHMHLHMATVPTPAQVETLRKYEAAGAVASTLEAGTDEYDSKHWHSDGFTRMTAGRIAAWAAQALEPAAAVGGYIDENSIGPTSEVGVWIDPDGVDVPVEPFEQHVDVAERVLRRRRGPMFDPVYALKDLGWIRVSINAGNLVFDLGPVPTPAQTDTLQKYLDIPNLELEAVSTNAGYLKLDGFTRMTAARIAAWAAQAGDLSGFGALPDNVSFSVKDWQDYTTVRATQTDAPYGEDDVVGVAEFWHRPDGTIVADQVSVLEKFQRQGIASHMYELAEEHTGKTIVRSDRQTPNGQSFWESR